MLKVWTDEQCSGTSNGITGRTDWRKKAGGDEKPGASGAAEGLQPSDTETTADSSRKKEHFLKL